MASVNVLEWITDFDKYVGSDILEVGSRKYKEHAFLDLKSFLHGRNPAPKVVGCDLSAGENVDVVVDLTAPAADVLRSFGGKTFDTIFCISVLEHVPNVFAAASNIQQLLAPGGALYLSVPFVFRYHGYPGDLWRFTPEAILHLFPEIDFRDLRYSTVTTMEQGDSMSLAGARMEKLNRFLYRPKGAEEKAERKRAKAAGEEVVAYSLAPAMINMLGLRKKPAASIPATGGTR